jgi:hypothetical protein
VAEVRARWLGHRLHAEVNVAVSPELSVAEGHAVAKEVNHRLLHHLGYLDTAVIHVDPLQEAGEGYHHIRAHSHDNLPVHSHRSRLTRTKGNPPPLGASSLGGSCKRCRKLRLWA